MKSSIARLLFRTLIPTICLGLLTANVHAAPGKAASVKGKVDITAPGAGAVALKSGDSVPMGSTVKTGAGGSAVVHLTKGSAIKISPNSTVVIQEAKEGTGSAQPKAKIKLRSGTAAALIREESKMDFKIETPHGIAAARGTFYAVSVKGGKTYAGVREGKIDVSAKE
jgi:hypothetical protein